MTSLANQNVPNDSPPKRIALIIPTLDRGGAEKQFVSLACNIDRSLFEPHVITLTRSGEYRSLLEKKNVPIYEVNKRGKFDPFALVRLRKIVQQIRPQLVHTWLFAANAYGRYAALKEKVPVIIGGERCVDPWKRGWQLVIDRYLSKRTQGILTNSSGVRDFYASKGIAPNKFTVIPNGIDPVTAPAITREEALRRLKLPTNARIIGSVGRLWPQKGYKDLIWAAGIFSVVNPEFHYVVIGDGPQRPILEQFRDSTGNANCMHLLGERSDVAQLLPHFDMFWNGSLYEGQSNSIMEAMQAGVPVMASDIPGNCDLIEHESSGLLYPVGAVNQLAKLATRVLHEEGLRDRLATIARQRIEQEFTTNRMVTAHERYYQTKLSQRGY